MISAALVDLVQCPDCRGRISLAPGGGYVCQNCGRQFDGTRGYLDPAVSHEQAADELALSRAAYFRRLRAAAERIAGFLGDR